MAYIGGDSSLREAAIGYLVQLEQAGSSEQVGVVVQVDGLGEPGHSYAARYVIGPSGARLRQNIGKVNTGDAGTLADFVKWGTSVAPARRYALLIMGHGTPVVALKAPFRGGLASSGLALDVGAGGDALTARELATGLTEGLRGNDSGKVDVLFLDCCFGGSIEVAYELVDVCNVVVASPGELYSPGLPWRRIVKRLKARPTMHEVQLARCAIHCAVAAWSLEPELNLTLVAVNLRKIRAVVAALKELSDGLGRNIGATAPAVTLARSRAQTWGPGGELCDLEAFAKALSESTEDAGVSALAQAVSARVEDAILDTYQQGEQRDEDLASDGLAILFPPSLSNLPTDYGNNCSMASDAGWGQFLLSYLRHLRSLLTSNFEGRPAEG